ncbi:MAG: acyltransferase [Polyangiaceae bacterium]
MSGVLGRHGPSAGKAIAQLDTLRGIGMVAVFVQHLGDRYMVLVERGVEASLPASVRPWIMTVLHHAWWGVDLFFVLSGFSLGLAYQRALDKGGGGEPSARAFFRRRAARILPGFWVALAAVLIARHALMAQPGFVSALGANLALLQGYVAPGGVVFIGASWTLTTEAHYYLLFPLLAVPLLRRRWWALGIALCMAVWLVRGALHAAVLEPGERTWLFELTQRRLIVSRLDQFVLGSLASLTYVSIERSGQQERAARWAPVALLAAAPLLVVAFRLEGELFLEPGGSWPYAALSLTTTVVVLAAALLDGRAARLFSAPPLSWIGVVSYGVFLNHQLVLGLTEWVAPFAAGDTSWARLAFVGPVAFLLSLGVGLASWRLVERPAIRWAAAASARR